MSNLGKAVGIMINAFMAEHERHEDLAAFHAPSECYTDVARGEAKRLRRARRHALAVAGCKNLRALRKEVRKRLGNDAAIYRRYGYVPY